MSWHFRSFAKTIPIHFLVTIILLLQCICNGAAIKCFVCDSEDNPSCTDLSSNASIVAEECTLEKMKSINTWLFDLNRFSYFDMGGEKSPLMNCQKVVTRHIIGKDKQKMVTARFCQLDVGKSDACTILKAKLEKSPNNGGGFGGGASGNAGAGPGQIYETQCSVCNTDFCNGSKRLRSSTTMILTGSVAAAIVLIMQKRSDAW